MEDNAVTSERPKTMKAEDRTRARFVAWALIIVAVTSLVIAAVLTSALLGKRAVAKDRLLRAVELIETADGAMLEADDVVQAPVTPELADRARSAAKGLDSAEDDLLEASELLESAMGDLGGQDSDVATELGGAIETRVSLLDKAREILAVDLAASSALGPSSEGWELVLKAEKSIDQAVERYNKHTKTSVQASRKLATGAKTDLERASALFSEAATAFPEAKISRYVRYCELKLKLVGTALKINSLWLSNKVTEANKLVATYNTQDKETAAEAKKLPESPSALIADTYEALTSERADQYFAIRARVREADERVRRASE